MGSENVGRGSQRSKDHTCQECYFSKTSELARFPKWTKYFATVGISDLAQAAMGDIQIVVPFVNPGESVAAGDEVVMLETNLKTDYVLSPVSGKVLKINSNLKEHPELINQSPYDEGWIFKMKLAGPNEIDGLMNKTAYVLKN